MCSFRLWLSILSHRDACNSLVFTVDILEDTKTPFLKFGQICKVEVSESLKPLNKLSHYFVNLEIRNFVLSFNNTIHSNYLHLILYELSRLENERTWRYRSGEDPVCQSLKAYWKVGVSDLEGENNILRDVQQSLIVRKMRLFNSFD